MALIGSKEYRPDQEVDSSSAEEEDGLEGASGKTTGPAREGGMALQALV